MFSYLSFFCAKTHAKLTAHMARTQNVLLQICFCFDLLVHFSIHCSCVRYSQGSNFAVSSSLVGYVFVIFRR